MRIDLTMPDDWVEAYKAAALAEFLSLSEWMGRQCNRGLPAEDRKRLSKRRKRGPVPSPERTSRKG